MKITINILATTDVHGYYNNYDYDMDNTHNKGSLVQIATVVKEQRKLCEHTILLDVGDMLQGNYSQLFEGERKNSAVVAMNYLGYDVWQMGNHEYGFGVDNLMRMTTDFTGKMICANVYKDGKRLHSPYEIIEIDGIKIAFIGMTTPLINQFEKSSKDDLQIHSTDIKKELEDIERQLKGKVDAMIGVIHTGVYNENNVKNSGLYDILQDDSSLIAVFCGHLHQIIDTKINDIVVLESGKCGQAISKLELVFEKNTDEIALLDKKTDIIYIDDSVKPDDELIQMLQPYHDRIIEHTNKKIGMVVNENMMSKNIICNIPQFRVEQSCITDFFIDILLYYGKADVAMIQLDNEDACLDYGDITIKDIGRNYTYVSGGITTYKITGKTLKKFLEHSADFYNSSKNGDVNISFNIQRLLDKYSSNYILGNIKYEIDLTKTDRIQNLRYMSGTIIGDEDDIMFATTKYTMEILKSQILEVFEAEKIYSSKDALGEDGSIRNLAISYIKEVLNSRVDMQKKQDWKIITSDLDEELKNKAVHLINLGYVSLINSNDGEYKNTKSINVYDAPDNNDEGLSKLGINIYGFDTRKELYEYAYEALKSRL